MADGSLVAVSPGSPALQRERKPLISHHLDNVEWEISNQATRIFRNGTITTLALAAIDGLLILDSHGSSLIQNYAGISLAGLTALFGIVYGSLKLFRDRPEKNRAEKGWKVREKEDLKEKLSELSEGERLITPIKLSGKTYLVELVRDEDYITISSQQ